MDLYKLACPDCVKTQNLMHSTSRSRGRCEFCGKDDIECRLAEVAQRKRLL